MIIIALHIRGWRCCPHCCPQTLTPRRTLRRADTWLGHFRCSRSYQHGSLEEAVGYTGPAASVALGDVRHGPEGSRPARGRVRRLRRPRLAERAVAELLPEAVWQRCYVHVLRNALDYLPRKADDDCRQELRWLDDRRDLREAQQDLHAWLQRWAQRHPRLTDWVEAQIGETLNFYWLPHQHHKHLKSTNLLERLNEEIKRRTRVVRIFPNPASCLRLIRALCVETHEAWLEDHRYLNMEFLKEQKKDLLQSAA